MAVDTIARGMAASSASAASQIENVVSGGYEGVDLTATFASEIAGYSDEWAWTQARIQAGNFVGLHIGDYIPFEVNGNIYNAQIAGINTYKGFGTTEIGNHIDFISKELSSQKAINPVNWNNGLIPVETITADGTATQFTLTKQMTEVASIRDGGTTLTGWTYDAETYTITFDTAPAAGTLTVVGAGAQSQWLTCDLYYWLNALAGQVPNSTDAPPATAVKHVDYTANGLYTYLPQALKDVIVEKQVCIGTRYNSSSKLNSDNNLATLDIGKLWLPTEFEIFGTNCFGGGGFTIAGNARYPLFVSENRVKKTIAGVRSSWWLLTAYGTNATSWCLVQSDGVMSGQPAGNSSRVPICFRIA